MQADWAGVSFWPLDHHDGRFVHAPGLWGFVRRERSGERTLLFVDHAEEIGQVARSDHPRFADALRLGLNELHVCLKAQERVDRLQLCAHIVRRVGPILNVLAQAHPAALVAPGAGVLYAASGHGSESVRRVGR